MRQILHGPRLQPKLTVGAPNDKFEREADRVADQVMRMPDSKVANNAEPAPFQPVGMPGILRRCKACEEKEKLRRSPLAQVGGRVQAKERTGGVPQVTDDVAAGIRSLNGGGQPLPESARSFFEPRFGADFGAVRVHTDSHAGELARRVEARAFTIGRDIVFGPGEYAPAGGGGRKLLAHELTHVVQQDGSLRRAGIGGGADSVVRRKENVGSEHLAGYTQCDFLDDHIAPDAQFALYHLYRRGDMARLNALSMLGAAKHGLMQGIFKADMGKPALMARRHGMNWWDLIPKGSSATVFEPKQKGREELPMMVFRSGIASDRAALGSALSGAWEASAVGQMPVIIPPPSLRPCPLIPPPPPKPEVKPEKKPEKKQCPPGTVPDPSNEHSCMLPPIGGVKTPCSDAEMAEEFQRQQEFCAGIVQGFDTLCQLGPSFCDAKIGTKFFCEWWEKITGKPFPLTKPRECSEPRSKFYEKCVVSTIVGERSNMPCSPGSMGQIRDKYRRWPGRVK